MGRILDSFKHRISRKIVTYILIVSSFLTLLLSILQIYSEYRRDLTLLDHELNLIERSFSSHLANSAWNFADEDILLVLEGISKLPNIRYVELVKETGDRVVKGIQPLETDKIKEKIFQLYVDKNERQYYVGFVHVHATLDPIFERSFQRSFYIIFSNLVKSLIVLSILFIIFSETIIRRITKLDNFIKKFDVNDSDIKLDKRVYTRLNGSDELDRLQFNLVDMAKKLQQNYFDLKEHEKNLEGIVEARTNQLKKMNAELQAYDHTVAHDLKNPVALISGYLEILQDEDSDEDDRSIAMEKISNATKQINSIIEGLLNFAVLGNEVEKEQINLINILKEVNTQLDVKIKEKDTVLNFENANDEIWADPLTLRQIMTNLVGNAIKYSDPDKKPIINITSDSEGDHTVIKISDNGVGIAKNKLPTIFDKMVRVHDLSVVKEEGQGIGLATVKKFVNANNGKIWVESQVGVGTTFNLAFYKSSEAFERAKSRDDDFVDLPNGLKVLVIDSNYELFSKLKIYLSSHFAHFDFVNSQKMIFEKMAENEFDYIFMTSALVEAAPIELVKAIKASDNGKNLNIIAVCNRFNQSFVEDFKNAGGDGFLDKEFERHDLAMAFTDVEKKAA